MDKKILQRLSLKNYQPVFRIILAFLLGIFIGVFLTLLVVFTVGKDYLISVQQKYHKPYSSVPLIQKIKRYEIFGYHLWGWNVVKDGNMICSNPYIWTITKEIECN